MVIAIPALAERPGDAVLLARHFTRRFARELGVPVTGLAPDAVDAVDSYAWPGNVRELENTLERAVLVCDGHVIHAHHLPPTLQTAEASGTVTRVSLRDAVAAYEKDLISDALKTTRGNRAKAARLLNTTERIINYQVKKYSIDYRRFKN
jgi:Nif-specific regulatory protein